MQLSVWTTFSKLAVKIITTRRNEEKRASDVGNKNLSCNIERNEEETKSSSSLAQQITNIIAL